MGRNRFSFLIMLALTAACGGGDRPDTGDLPRLGANPVVSVSGVSSGGYMAGQYQVAYSASVMGAAIIAAGPWGCALGDLSRALGPCLTGDGLDIEPLTLKAREMAGNGQVDPLEGLQTHRVLVFRGRNDEAVGAAVADAALAFLSQGDSTDRFARISDVPAAHAWVTDKYGADCASFAAPYIVDCGYDLAGAVLEHLHGARNTPATAARRAMPFSQSAFGDAGLADTGYVYIPDACASTGCRIHVFFHGCEQSAETIGTDLVDNAGFNEWAESNDIIVLYPQVAPSRIAPVNPLGCWDWWGYTTDDYAAKDAPQLAAVRAMVDRLASRP